MWALRGEILQDHERLVGAPVVDKREKNARVLRLLRSQPALRVTAGARLATPGRNADYQIPDRVLTAAQAGVQNRGHTSSDVNCRNFWMGRRFSSL